jgi:hypothetical protein
MALPQPFSTVGEQLVNYNWQDLYKGVGYISYYLGLSTNNSATTYFITPSIQDSSPPYQTTNATPIDRDFDLSFDKEEDIEGTFIFNFTQRPGSEGNSGNCVTQITIYHVNSSATETSLGTSTTATQSGSGTYYRENIQITVSRKHFSPGEKLRINVIFTGSGNNGAIYFDPASGLSVTDTYTRTVGTDFTIQIPFKIEA